MISSVLALLKEFASSLQVKDAETGVDRGKYIGVRRKVTRLKTGMES